MNAFATAISLAARSGLSARPSSVIRTQSLLTDLYSVRMSSQHVAWNRVIDDLFIPWASGQVEVDDDIVPPSPASLRTAIHLAYQYRDSHLAAPTDVLPNGIGGIWMEHRNGSSAVQIEVLRDGSIGISEFVNGDFVGSRLVPASDFVPA